MSENQSLSCEPLVWFDTVVVNDVPKCSSLTLFGQSDGSGQVLEQGYLILGWFKHLSGDHPSGAWEAEALLTLWINGEPQEQARLYDVGHNDEVRIWRCWDQWMRPSSTWKVTLSVGALDHRCSAPCALRVALYGLQIGIDKPFGIEDRWKQQAADLGLTPGDWPGRDAGPQIRARSSPDTVSYVWSDVGGTGKR